MLYGRIDYIFGRISQRKERKSVQSTLYTLVLLYTNLRLQELKQKATCRHCSECNLSCTCIASVI